MDAEKRLPGLCGLRAVFSIGIVLFHVNKLFHSVFSGLLSPVYTFGGYFGNYIFFIISGLLMAFHYKDAFLGRQYPLFLFAKKQILKIYPLYVLSNLAAMLLPGSKISAGRTLATLSLTAAGKPYVPYNEPAWFLCVLLFCYLLYYLIGSLSFLLPSLYLPLCGLFAAGGMLLMKLDLEIPFLSCTCGEGCFNFFLGAFLGEAARNPGAGRRVPLIAACAVLSIFTVCIACFGLADMPGEMRWNISVICLCLVCLALYAKPLTRLLEFFPLRTLGACSFSLYLWHVPFAQWFSFLENKLGLRITDQRPNFVLYLVLLIELSILSHRVLERQRRSFS